MIFYFYLLTSSTLVKVSFTSHAIHPYNPRVKFKTLQIIALYLNKILSTANAQQPYSEQLAAGEENFDNNGEFAFDEVVGIGEGGGYTPGIESNEAARNYDEDSEVITGVTDSGSSIGNIDITRQSYVQAPDQYESQSAPKAFNMRCVEKNERYPVPGSCDRYIECLVSIALL